ncbi:DNRLRE domain-containing protein [Paenibacillus oenotherae]|uniref:DNRLRE domain-containing protein n=1 Tax=Paenibacillus oenotherae TaxID=1435645 RepID=A0ABS7D2L0_9BACL|nr:DNRLRE domain-containing protein [Paenibacillus oenotherae]MBW7474084.1 DNRLRE domain-containing protein [Paenibacillus oenotherae]
MENDSKSIGGYIFISPRNKMSGKVNIIGSGKSSLPASITVSKFDSLHANIAVYSDYVIEDAGNPPRTGNQRKANIYIRYRHQIQGSLFITPTNRMSGLLDIIQPPSYITELPSVKDAFVRSNIPTLNYGTEQSMIVGCNSTNKEKYRSLIQFDIDELPDNITVEKAELKMFNSQVNNSNHQIGVYTSSASWEETGVTWLSQPAVQEIITVQSLGSQSGYIRIDVTNQVKEWYAHTDSNYGFIIKAMDEAHPQIENFSTRESSSNKPFIEVTYKHNKIYSAGRSEIPSNIVIVPVGYKNIIGKIVIPEYESDRNFPSHIHVLNLNYWLESQLVVNKKIMPSHLIVRQNKDHSIPGHVIVRVKGGHLPQDRLIGNLFVIAKSRPGKITVKYRDSINASLTVRRIMHDQDEITSNLIVIRNSTVGNLIVRQQGSRSLPSSIQTRIHKVIPSNILINKKIMPGHLVVTYYKQINGRIDIREHDNLTSRMIVPYRKNIPGRIDIIYATHLPSSIQVLSGYLRANLIIPSYGEHVITGRMIVRVKGISEINSSITVGGDNIPGGYVYIL